MEKPGMDQYRFDQLQLRKNRRKEKIRKIADELAICAITVVGSSIVAYTVNSLLRKYYSPQVQTRPVEGIGDPNARDQNDTFVTINGVDYFGRINGKSVRDYLNSRKR